MSKFYLSKKAVEDLNDIWDYTVSVWSPKQAEIYYSLLIDSCKAIAKNPNLGKSYNLVQKNILAYKTGEHIIFYQITNTTEIDVVRILHRMMDLKNHID